MNFATFDPGAATGLAIWSDIITNSQHPPRWTLVNVGTVKYSNYREFGDRLEAIKRNHGVAFAVIEKWVNYGRRFANSERMVVQQQIIADVWPAHIWIAKNEWDPARTKPRMQRQIIEDYGIDCPKSEHERDALNIGINIFRRLPFDAEYKAGKLCAAAAVDHKIKLM